MIDDGDALHAPSPLRSARQPLVHLEHRSVADDRERRRAVAAPLARQPPARRPGAAFEHLGERKRGCREAELRADRAAIRSRSATVSARHSTTSVEPTACVRSASAGSLRASTPASRKSPPLRYSGSPVRPSIVDDLEARPFQRLDQRIGEPLRQLVEGHEPRVRVAARRQRMAPGVAEIDAAEHDAPGQIGPRWARSASRIAGAAILPSLAPSARTSNSPPGRGSSFCPKTSGSVGDDAAEPVEERGAPLEADERVVRPDLEACGEILRRIRAASASASTRKGSSGGSRRRRR